MCFKLKQVLMIHRIKTYIELVMISYS